MAVADLQPAARRHRGARRRARGAPHHRDQLAERRGRAARAHRQPARHLRRRGNTRTHYAINQSKELISVENVKRSRYPSQTHFGANTEFCVRKID